MNYKTYQQNSRIYLDEYPEQTQNRKQWLTWLSINKKSIELWEGIVRNDAMRESYFSKLNRKEPHVPPPNNEQRNA